MPDLMSENGTTMQNLSTSSNYSFSAVGLDDLGASEYTLATIVVDISASVTNWRKELENCLSVIAESCKDSPRSENLLVRVLTFNNNVQELHGFKLLEDISPDDYNSQLQTGGCTSLFDAVCNAVEVTKDYSKILVDQGDMSVNAIVYVLTDGQDNNSTNSATSVKKLVSSVNQEEVLDDIKILLIGLGYDDCATYLDDVKNKTNMDEFVDLTELFKKQSPKKVLSKLAGYISKSISVTSQSLSTGVDNSSSLLSNSTLTF